MSNSMDLIKTVEEERNRRMAAEAWRAQHENDMANMENQIATLNKALKNEQLNNEFLKKELSETKEKLNSTSKEVTLLKDEPTTVNGRRPSNADTVTPSNEGGGVPLPSAEPQVRSWNKKVIADMHDVSKQLSNERKLRIELEQWKAETEGKMEEMKKKVRREVEERIQLEETLKKMERELNNLKKNGG